MRRTWWLCVLVGCGGESGGETPTADVGGDAGLEADAALASGCSAEVPAGWVCFEAGEFSMGSPESEPLRDMDEAQHAVSFAQPLLVKATEVTQGEWTALMGNNPAYFAEGDNCDRGCETRPVERVNLFDAMAYCNAASAAAGLTACYVLDDCAETPGTGCEPGVEDCTQGYRCRDVVWVDGCDGFRLPTESEWEYFARAGETGARYGLEGTEVGWFAPRANRRTHEVGGLEPNAMGLYDVIGNVGEWTWDLYDPSFGIFRPERMINPDPRGGEFGDTRVVRGCGHISGSRYCRLAARESQFPAQHSHALGFRPVRNIR